MNISMFYTDNNCRVLHLDNTRALYKTFNDQYWIIVGIRAIWYHYNI